MPASQFHCLYHMQYVIHYILSRFSSLSKCSHGSYSSAIAKDNNLVHCHPLENEATVSESTFETCIWFWIFTCSLHTWQCLSEVLKEDRGQWWEEGEGVEQGFT